MAKQALKYFVLDVFSTERYRGNPLAVVAVKEDLPIKTYTDISREFGYSETSFVRFSKDKNTLFVRSFTPTGFEINGAGHNLLGAVRAVLLRREAFKIHKNETPDVIMKDRPIALDINGDTIGLLQQAAVIKQRIPSEPAAEALSLSKEETGFKELTATVVATDVSHAMVPLKNVAVLEKAEPNKPLLRELANQYGFQGAYCFSIGKENPEVLIKARFFNPGIGIDEDPATGSAAGPLAGFLYHHQIVDKNKIYTIEQGEKMNRPSNIQYRIEENGIQIRGSAIIVMEGAIYV